MAFQMDECGHRAATCMNYMPGFITPNTLCCLLHSDHCTWAQAIYLFDSDHVAHCHCCQISRTYLTFSRIFIKIQWFSTKLSISRVFLATLKKKSNSRTFKEFQGARVLCKYSESFTLWNAFAWFICIIMLIFFFFFMFSYDEELVLLFFLLLHYVFFNF